MAKYRKLAITVTAEIIDRPQYVTTLEGVSKGNPGDYLVTGIDYEQWFVKPEWFNDSYTHLYGNQYRRNPQVLEAVQIDKPEVVSAPTGPIKGDKGDWKITGKSGEQWFVKPDIFDKTYEPVNKGGKKKMDNQKNGLQKAIDQLGMDIVQHRYTPMGMKIHDCPMHGKFLAHYKDANPLCPLCHLSDATRDENNNEGNGTTATQVEHYIDIKDACNGTGDI